MTTSRATTEKMKIENRANIALAPYKYESEGGGLSGEKACRGVSSCK